MILEVGGKGSLSEKTENYTSEEVIYVSSPKMLVSIDKLKNLMEWTMTASILQIIGSTLIGGTFLGQSLPLVFGSVGVVMIAVAVLIEVIKFDIFIRSNKKRNRRRILYCNVTKTEIAENNQLQKKEESAPVQN
jgi:hypothetical protein